MRRALAVVATLCLCALAVGCDSGDGSRTPVTIALDGTDPAIAAKLTELQAAAAETPASAPAHGHLGMAYEINGFVEAAHTSYRNAVALDATEPRWRYYLAQTTARLGDVEGAVTSMQQVLVTAPDYAPAWLYLGNWQLDLGQSDDALTSFERARAAAPRSGIAHLGLARARLDRGEAERAIELLEPLSTQIRHPYVYQLLGRAYRMAGDTGRAREVLSRAGAGSDPPSWPDPWDEPKQDYLAGFGADLKRAQALFESGATDEAIVQLEALYSRRPADRTLLNNLSAAYNEAGRADDALRVLQEGVERYPDFFPLQLNLAAVYAGRSQFDSALAHVERALVLNPSLAQAHEMRGSYLLGVGRRREALDSYERALSYGRDSRSVLATVAALNASFGRWEAAAGHAERLTRLDPSFGRAWVILGRARAEGGDFGGAEAAFDKAGALGPDDPRLAESRLRLRDLRGY